MPQELEFSYRIERSARRRRMAIHIDNAEVVVRVPSYVAETEVLAWLLEKQSWIKPRLAKQAAALSEHYIDHEGDTLPLLGRPFHLCYSLSAKRSQVDLAASTITVAVTGKATVRSKERLLKQLLNEFAGTHLTERTAQLSNFTGLAPLSVATANYKRKWGQCSSRKEVTLNWRLVHLNQQLQDYVIIHELCHLKEMNHSARFWGLVAEFFPDYQLARQEMKGCFSYLNW